MRSPPESPTTQLNVFTSPNLFPGLVPRAGNTPAGMFLYRGITTVVVIHYNAALLYMLLCLKDWSMVGILFCAQ
ncbi:hypothetical protein I7I48_04035 [Histoplasma ohiense]|nr:hypothetical protein I7I48_04035 [Histoplasma ohiense (nom. inval.)]